MASAAEHCRIEIKMPNDPRAIGAVRGALEHTARHLGLSTPEEEALADAAEHLLSAALAALAAEAEITVTIQEHPNRIEIELVRPGGSAGEWAELRKLRGIDRLEEENDAGHTRLKLVKFLPGGAGPPAHGR
ncbi:MAG TPA: hypothetical protein VGS20_08805 [Candidatus Acidoferrales bacterium]|nr:hypothetical protein [Candidatus Acidoferrales bacterium]